MHYKTSEWLWVDHWAWKFIPCWPFFTTLYLSRKIPTYEVTRKQRQGKKDNGRKSEPAPATQWWAMFPFLSYQGTNITLFISYEAIFASLLALTWQNVKKEDNTRWKCNWSDSLPYSQTFPSYWWYTRYDRKRQQDRSWTCGSWSLSLSSLVWIRRPQTRTEQRTGRHHIVVDRRWES